MRSLGGKQVPSRLSVFSNPSEFVSLSEPRLEFRIELLVTADLQRVDASSVSERRYLLDARALDAAERTSPIRRPSRGIWALANCTRARKRIRSFVGVRSQVRTSGPSSRTRGAAGERGGSRHRAGPRRGTRRTNATGSRSRMPDLTSGIAIPSDGRPRARNLACRIYELFCLIDAKK